MLVTLGTNPDPSFVGHQINQMLLFRNRIVFLSGENVVMTTSGGLRPVNFFSTSALTSLATDPIDVSAASKELHCYGMVLKLTVVFCCLLKASSI